MPSQTLLADRLNVPTTSEERVISIAPPPVERQTAWSMLARRLRGSSLIALADQLIVSCGNFLTNILVARALAPNEYGVYALMLDAILFLNSLQAALLVYPLTVRAALMDEYEVRRFSGTCTVLTMLMAVPLGALLIGYGALNHHATIAVWAALGQTLWQCQEILRRTMLARGSFARALIGDTISYIGQAVVIWMLIFGGNVDVSRIFMSIALTSMLAAAVQGFQLNVRPAGLRGTFEIGRSFWRLGRWVMASNLSMFFSSVCCSYALARSHGTQVVGAYAALGNLLRLANPLMITLSTLIVPAVAVAYERSGLHAARRATIRLATGGAVMLVPYWAVLYIFPEWSVAKMYPTQTQYHNLAPELRVFVAASMVTMVNIAIIAMFNGLRRSRRAMAGQLCGAAASLFVTIPLTVKFGLWGILMGTLASNGLIAIVLLILSNRLQREHTAADLQPAT